MGTNTSFLPGTDAGLLAWSSNFSTLITATPTDYGLTAPQATAFSALNDAYAAALAAVEPGVRSKTTVAAKNTAKDNLKNQARLLASIIQGQATVTDAQKIELGLTVRAQPSPQPPPQYAPAVDVVAVNGHTVSLRLHDSQTSKRGRPPGVKGAAVFSFVGATAPNDPAAWTFQGNTTKTEVDVTFPDSLAPGTLVWICAMWFNERAQSGPGCEPISTNIQFGNSMAA